MSKNGAEEIELTINFGNSTNLKKLARDNTNRLFKQTSYTQKTINGDITKVVTNINDIIAKYTKYGYSEENLNSLATRL